MSTSVALNVLLQISTELYAQFIVTRNSAVADKPRGALFCANAMVWLTSSKHAPPHMSRHAEFGRSALKGVGINTGEPPEFRERWNAALLGWEAWLTPRYTPLPTYVTTSNLVVLRQRVYA